MKSEPAFPCAEERNTSSDPLATPREILHTGMTLRDYFAGQAIVIFRRSIASNISDEDAAKKVAKLSYEIADAMLEERVRR